MITHRAPYRHIPERVAENLVPDTELAARPSIAVLIPCFNEARLSARLCAISKRAADRGRVRLRQQLHRWYAAVAAERWRDSPSEPLQGKGNVVRRMFADVEADAYVLVDGDGTYDADSASRMVERLIGESLDMVNAAASPPRARIPPLARVREQVLTGAVARFR